MLVKYLNTNIFKKTMAKKTLLTFLFILTMFTMFVSALDDYGVKQVDEQFTFCQVCQDATYITLSSIETPDTTEGIYENMTSMGAGEYCYNYTPQKLGRYDFRGVSDGCEKTFATYMDITYTGKDLTMEETTMYLGVLVFLVLILIYLLYLYPKLPKHQRNDDGYVINISNLSYLRPVTLGFMWILILSITYIVANISVAYITAGFLGSFIFGIWTIMMYSNFIILPLWVVYIIHDLIKTAQIKEFLERGGTNFY